MMNPKNLMDQALKLFLAVVAISVIISMTTFFGFGPSGMAASEAGVKGIPYLVIFGVAAVVIMAVIGYKSYRKIK